MKAKRIKAALVDTYEDARFEERRWLGEAWQLPADAASYERMVEQMAFALGRRKWFKTFPARKEFADEIGNKGLDVWIEEVQTELRAQARFALRAIGITAPKRGKKGSQ